MEGSLSEKLLQISRFEVYKHRTEPFVLASGAKSHHYFDCRKITLHPQRLELLARVLRDETIPGAGLEMPDSLGGLTMGADPIILALSLAYGEKGFVVFPLIVRKEIKSHGLGRMIEGELEFSNKTLVIDDVVTSGSSSIKAIHVLRDSGKKVNSVVCVIDREEGGKEALLNEGVHLYSVFKKSDFTQNQI